MKNLLVLEESILLVHATNCPNLSKCKLDKYFYKTKAAHGNYLYTLQDSREGVNLTTAELFNISNTIKPLIEHGQFLYTILENYKELNICPKTLYTYIEMGIFEAFSFFYGENIKKLNIQKIEKDKVTLQPYLLKNI